MSRPSPTKQQPQPSGETLASRIRSADKARLRAFEHAQERMRASFPRLQMSLIVALTGGSGLLASFLLLQGGIHSMAVRYPSSVALAYVVFLLLLWIWLRTTRREWIDVADIPLPTGGSGNSGIPIDLSLPFRGGGGDFGGGGASASFGSGVDFGNVGDASDMLSSPVKVVGEAAGKVADGLDLDAEALPIMAVLLIIGFVVVLASAAFYVIYIAPALLAEVVVDGALTYALYRRVRVEESRSWLMAACRRTAIPFAVTAIFVSCVGMGMSMYAPGARSVGEVIHYSPK